MLKQNECGWLLYFVHFFGLMINSQCIGWKSSWRLKGDLGYWNHINFTLTWKLVWPTFPPILIGLFSVFCFFGPSAILPSASLVGSLYTTTNLQRWHTSVLKNVSFPFLKRINWFNIKSQTKSLGRPNKATKTQI